MRRQTKGFTLVEVLVAIAVMALMALMSWRGIDGMLRTQSGLQTRADELRTLQAALAQWQTDLSQLADLNSTPSWAWDGKAGQQLKGPYAAVTVEGDMPAPATGEPGGQNTLGLDDLVEPWRGPAKDS